MQLRNLQTSSNEIEALIGYINAQPAIRDVTGAKSIEAKKGAVRFDQVMFQYQTDTPLLYDHLNLDIPEGQKVALVGHSGSGKSTFVKLLQRLYDIQGGAITIDGQNIAEVTQRSLRRHIALVPQEPILFHRSLFSNRIMCNWCRSSLQTSV
jgi:ATP-binding cassette subfamily B protein